jgi:hypothetical protein
MKNKITDLRDHLFAQMERLNNEDLTPEELKKEIERAQAMSELGKVIVDSAKTQVMAAKYLNAGDRTRSLKGISEDDEDFANAKVLPLQRPPAEYDNDGHAKALKRYGGG